MTELQMGANIELAATVLRATLAWTAGPGVPDVDVSALLLDAGGRVGSEADFVFYNQPQHPSGAVSVTGAAVDVDLSRVPAATTRIALAASTGSASFGQVPGFRLALTDRADATPVATFAMRASDETAFVCAEFYRHDGRWKFRAVGQGYASGLAGLATDFGIDVSGADDAPAAAPPTPAASPPAASPPVAAREPGYDPLLDLG